MGCGLSKAHHSSGGSRSITGNARTTFQGRLLIVERFLEGCNKAHISAAMGTSRKCVHKLDQPLRYGGLPLGCRIAPHVPDTTLTRTPAVSRGPDPGATPGATWPGQDLIGAALGVPTRTVSRVLARRGVPHLRDCDPMTVALIRASKRSSGALRTCPARRTGPHRHQEARTHPRRRRMAGTWPRLRS